ncbi:MAG: hypothetical protein ACRDD7_09855 [Peptostreptococcaceae bacterium]
MQYNFDKDKLLRLIDEKYTLANIVGELEVDKEIIKKYMKDNGLKTKKCNNLVGRIFTKLKVLEYVGRDKHGSLYLCECECGNKIIAKAGSLTMNNKKSCGCFKNREARQKENYNKALERIGEKHHRLTIIDIEYIEGKSYIMVCKCDCGNIIKVKYAYIANGGCKSCGCYQRDRASEVASKYGINNFFKDKKWYFIKDNKKISCRSGYEVIFANWLTINNIEFEYESKCFELSNKRRYTPDFYIVNEDKYIEIKGKYENIYDLGNQPENRKLFEQDHSLEIYYWTEIVKNCNLPYRTYQHYKYVADRLNIKVEDYLGKMIYLLY